ncbi:putative SP-containing membrane protein [Vairimorpha necatrix]|uniref:SP-containing membrane protein n=1 Tax=Vairimorpha necatrix TaxID=6039 RepID=A0AAX4J9F8_9MICR
MFGFIFCILKIFAFSKDYQTVLEVIKRLHRDTEYKTIYDLFGVYSFTSTSAVQKKFVKLITAKETPPRINLPLKDFKNLVTACYDVIKNKKSAYDEILNNRYLMYDDKKNYTNSRYMIAASLLALLLSLDLVFYCYNFIKYLSLTKSEIEDESNSKKKKKARKNAVIKNMTKPDMYIYKGYKKIMSLLGK